MKVFKLFVCSILFLSLFAVSCSDDDDDNLRFDNNKVDVIIGKTETVIVKDGDGTYTATSSNDLIATATVNENEIAIEGIEKGNVTIKVSDESGKTGIINVTIIEDPNLEIKDDPTTRFVWDEFSKVEGTDLGTYEMTQSVDGKVEFSWISEDANNTITLSFADEAGSIAEGIKEDAKLFIDGDEVAVTSLEVIQNKEAVTDNNDPTVWIVFQAKDKKGVCVAKLSSGN